MLKFHTSLKIYTIKNKTHRHVHWQTYSKLKVFPQQGSSFLRTVHLVIILLRHVRYNKDWGYVWSSETRTLRQALTSSMIFPLSHRRQNRKRKTFLYIHILLCQHTFLSLEYIYVVLCRHSWKWFFSISRMCYVDIIL